MVDSTQPPHTLPESETIVAISTPLGQAGVGIVRLSGPRAIAIGHKLFRTKGPPLGQQIQHIRVGITVNELGLDLDQALAWVFKGPHSYTGEDVVELSCHGNVLILESVVRTAIFHGAVLAKQGEFTRRAFLNGKMDLLQAEAVLDLVRAGAQVSLDNAYGHLNGTLSHKVGKLRSCIVKALSHIEVLLDFSEDDVSSDNALILQDIESALGQCKQLADTYWGCSKRQDGISVAIIGPPNAGKSSLFNFLLSENRAIVSHTPGTTRDLIEGQLYYKGELFRLIDSAGLHPTDDLIEKEGIRRALSAVEESDFSLLVLDASLPWSDSYGDLLAVIKPERDVIALNKSDLERNLLPPPDLPFLFQPVSAVTGAGTPQLLDGLLSKRPSFPLSEGVGITRLRHYNCLRNTAAYLENALSILSSQQAGPECIADDLRFALREISDLQGIGCSDEVLDFIFSEFCIGK